MIPSSISKMRLINQHVGGAHFHSVKELVQWMGAVQSQDYNMSKWAIGTRLRKSTHRSIEEAINNGEIIRTHVLRPTWHLVAAEDVKWMMELTATNINRVMSSNNKRLELDEKTFKKCNGIIETLLRNGKHLTRKEIMATLEKKGIRTDDLRASHIMFRAETDLVVCNGIRRDKQFTYALFEERVPPTKKLTREEALAKLAEKYFRSHGPATLQDFSWWSGLSLTDATKGLEPIKAKLVSEKIGEKTLWLFNDSSFEKTKMSSLLFLPAFDEFLISYKSRDISLDAHFNNQTFTINGIFNPIIVHNAKVIGIWKPQVKKEISVKEYFFSKPTEQQKQLCMKALNAYRKFWK